MDDNSYMLRALELAQKAWGKTSPNPMVGAVLVKNGRVIGEGFHTRDGEAHAEIECLLSAKESPEGATLYVTLEPCSTRGRTGACTDAIIAAKIASVKIGATDPNPLHAGRAEEIFGANSIDCQSGILAKECSDLNFIFNASIVSQKAVLAIKYAISKDGKISARRGERTRITSDAALADVMKWRRLFSSIGVGYGTLVADNPRLTSRINGDEESCAMRLIFDASLKCSENPALRSSNVFTDAFASRTLLVCPNSADEKRQLKLERAGIGVLRVDADDKNSPEFWDTLKRELFRRRVNSLYVEGGAEIFASICKAQAADYAFEYVAPFELGDPALDAFEDGKNFNIDADEISLGPDTLKFGKVIWTPKK